MDVQGRQGIHHRDVAQHSSELLVGYVYDVKHKHMQAAFRLGEEADKVTLAPHVNVPELKLAKGGCAEVSQKGPDHGLHPL